MNVVAQNANPGSAFLSRSDLDEFLFAPVIDDANGMTVSVLSMLARAGVDPRNKAAELARMTMGKATDALTSFVGDSLRGLVSRDDIETIAARLAALLPRRTNPINPPGQKKDRQHRTNASTCGWDSRDLHLLPNRRDMGDSKPAVAGAGRQNQPDCLGSDRGPRTTAARRQMIAVELQETS